MNQPQFPCRVGDVVIAGTFRVSPEELTVHSRAQTQTAVQAVPGGVPAQMRGAVRSSELPASLLVANAVSRLRGAGMFHDYEVSVAHTGRARMISRPVLGEPVTVVATVRYRSARQGLAHVTYLVELRRKNGQVATRFEVGVDLVDAHGVAVDDGDERRAA